MPPIRPSSGAPSRNPLSYARPLVFKNTKIADDIITKIIEVIEQADGVIKTIQIRAPDFTIPSGNTNMPCKYGEHCTQKNPIHLTKYAHPDNIVYLSPAYIEYLMDIAEAIDAMELYIRKIVSLTYDLYKMDLRNRSDYNMELWRVEIAKKLLQGAKLSIPIKAGRKRFYPENTIYFYLLANIHKHFDDYAGDTMYRNKRFFNILFMRMEELYDATGLYQITSNEYEILFQKKISIPKGANFKGVNHEPNGFFGLANTALLSGFQISQTKLIDSKSHKSITNDATVMDEVDEVDEEEEVVGGRSRRSRSRRSRTKKNKRNRKTRKRII